MLSGASFTPIALTIAGSDSGGGAGIQADLKTFAALGVYGCSAITSLTAQNTLGVQGVLPISPDFVAAQITSVMTDIRVTAIKTGMLANREIIVAVANALQPYTHLPLVVDPVMVATSGDRLLSKDAIAVLIQELFPLATLVTPNLFEAAALLGQEPAQNRAEMKAQSEQLLRLGARAVLLKGGHGTGVDAEDFLMTADGIQMLSTPRIATRNTHGTGCTLASAIAAGLAKGLGISAAVKDAKDFIQAALLRAGDLVVGQGSGPVHHFHRFY